MEIEIPAELQKVLNAHPDVQAKFNKFPPSHKKEWLDYIFSAKKPETRQRRLEKFIKDLS